jgi:hypothetical protein
MKQEAARRPLGMAAPGLFGVGASRLLKKCDARLCKQGLGRVGLVFHVRTD